VPLADLPTGLYIRTITWTSGLHAGHATGSKRGVDLAYVMRRGRRAPVQHKHAKLRISDASSKRDLDAALSLSFPSIHS